VKVLLRNPRREVEVDGPITVHALLQRFELSPETVLVIVGDELVTHDRKLADDASVEIRPVISGGGEAEPYSDQRDGEAEPTITGGRA
jgi:sulfur carrier protein